jgi:competence protein ComEA
MPARGGRFLFGLLTGLFASGILYLLLAEPRGAPIALLPPPTPAPLRIHVAGAVRQPGIVEVASEAIVADAIDAAGGALPGADLDALNLAAPLQSGQRIVVNLPGTASPTESSLSSSSAAGLNLNLASAADFESLPGIGPSLAAAIVAYRDRNGPFLSVDELLNVPGIGPTRMTQLRPLVRVE